MSGPGASLLLAGYFGCGNLGDDAILLGFLEGLRETSVDVAVLSGFPEETHRLYGVRTVPRKSLGEVAQAIARCDALVFPGGSIFQDATSSRSVIYYANLVKMAKAKRKKVVLLGQGIGPLTSFFGKRAAAGAFNQCDLIVVRDAASAQTLKDLGYRGTARVAADQAFLLPAPPAGGEESFQVGGMRSVGLFPRPWGKTSEVVGLFGDLCRLLYQANYIPTLIAMDREADVPLIHEIEKTQGGKVPSITKLQTPMQVQQRLARMDAVLAMRLHGGILAATVDVPPFMLSYDPKVAAFARQMDLPFAPNINNLNASRLFDEFSRFLAKRNAHAEAVAKSRQILAAQARENVRLLLEQVAA